MVTRSNEEWLRALGAAGGDEHAEALADLRGAMERAALFYLRRRAAGLEGLTWDQVESLAQDIAQETVLQVLDKLSTFRGDSRFLTWASAVAVGKAMVYLRRRKWRDVSLEQMPDGWQQSSTTAVASSGWGQPQLAAERREIWQVIRDVVQRELTDRQRQVLNLVVINGANAEEVAERLGSSPGALYKLTHDARRKLKAGLLQRGFSTQDILNAFATPG